MCHPFHLNDEDFQFATHQQRSYTMRGLLIGLLAVLVATPAFAQEIVIFDSYAGDFGGIEAARLAAAMVGGATVGSYGAGQEASWIADVNNGADIVVFDVCSNYTASVPHHILSAQLDAMHAWHLSNPDGCGVLALWFMGFEPHPIYAYYGVSRCNDFGSVIPLYQWTSDPVWSGVPNPVPQGTDAWAIDGSMVEPAAGTEVLGGFTASAQTCQAGLVAHNSRHTWFIGETGNGGDVDSDFDGTYDWVELYFNIFGQCGAGPTAAEPTTWSAVKNLYR
jgi:hypothetical protein